MAFAAARMIKEKDRVSGEQRQRLLHTQISHSKVRLQCTMPKIWYFEIFSYFVLLMKSVQNLTHSIRLSVQGGIKSSTSSQSSIYSKVSELSPKVKCFKSNILWNKISQKQARVELARALFSQKNAGISPGILKNPTGNIEQILVFCFFLRMFTKKTNLKSGFDL